MAKAKQAARPPRAANRKVALNAEVEPELREAVLERAKRDERSMSYIVREALKQYLGLGQAVTA